MKTLQGKFWKVKEILRKVRKQLAKFIIKYPFTMILLLFIAFFSVPYLLLGILHFLEWHFQEFNWCLPSSFIALQSGAEGWFSFWGSYLGMVATIIVAFITLRLDLTITKNNRASDINKLTVREVRLYDLWRDFTPSVLKSQESPKRFALHLIFDKYEPYYAIKIENVYWERIDNEQTKHTNPKKYRKQKKSSDGLEFSNVQIKGPSILEEYLYFNDKENVPIEHTFNYFYRIHCFEPIMMSQYDKQRCLRMTLSLHNMLYDSHPEKIDVEMNLTLESGSYGNGYMKLDIKNFNLTIY